MLLAVLCGAALGYERERHGRSAGLRTNLPVCLGVTLIIVVSKYFYYTSEEMAHSFTATDKEDGKPAIRSGWSVPIKLAIFSGLRPGEQFALRLDDLDFRAAQVRVRRERFWEWKWQTAGQPRWHITSRKTETSIRNLDLPPDLLEDLRRYIAGLRDKDSELMWC